MRTGKRGPSSYTSIFRWCSPPLCYQICSTDPLWCWTNLSDKLNSAFGTWRQLHFSYFGGKQCTKSIMDTQLHVGMWSYYGSWLQLSNKQNIKTNNEITFLPQKFILECALHECSMWKHSFIYQVIGIFICIRSILYCSYFT